jgi:hypothetical protein
MEIYICFTKTTQYTWSGELSELPAAARKGAVTGRGDDAELNEETLGENLIDEILEKLAKKADINETTFEVDELGQQ